MSFISSINNIRVCPFPAFHHSFHHQIDQIDQMCGHQTFDFFLKMLTKSLFYKKRRENKFNEERKNKFKSPQSKILNFIMINLLVKKSS